MSNSSLIPKRSAFPSLILTFLARLTPKRLKHRFHPFSGTRGEYMMSKGPSTRSWVDDHAPQPFVLKSVQKLASAGVHLDNL